MRMISPLLHQGLHGLPHLGLTQDQAQEDLGQGHHHRIRREIALEMRSHSVNLAN
jgi:hypothetical protein